MKIIFSREPGGFWQGFQIFKDDAEAEKAFPSITRQCPHLQFKMESAKDYIKGCHDEPEVVKPQIVRGNRYCPHLNLEYCANKELPKVGICVEPRNCEWYQENKGEM